MKIFRRPKELLEFLYLQYVTTIKENKSVFKLSLPNSYNLLRKFLKKEKINVE